ncbi:MAG: kelch repeat-containing protein [Marinicella sp.]
MNNWGLLLACLLLCQCAIKPVKQADLPAKLPFAVSNNAVAYLNLDNEHQLFTFNGLKSGKTYQDITKEAHVWRQGQWYAMDVPEEQLPVLASVAVSVKDAVYLFGGYTVAADHSEKSIPNVWRIDGYSHEWTVMPTMPTPVDDTVALVYKDRYIYLVSGWHDVDNVWSEQLMQATSPKSNGMKSRITVESLFIVWRQQTMVWNKYILLVVVIIPTIMMA